MRRSFAGRVCIVTGGASGLGKELCRQLSDLGAFVIVADIDESKGRAVAAEINSVAESAHPITVDVANSHSVENLIDRVLAKFGRIDYLFNNAGVAILGEFCDFTLDQWRHTLDVNLSGVINGIHYCYPIMIRQGFGHIVNTASAFEIVPVPLCGPYVASKFAIFGLTNALRVEAQGFGINATVVCPGFVKTEMSETFQSLARVQMMDVRDAAKHILSKVSEGKGVIVFPVYVRILEFLFRFFPWAFTKIVSRRVSKFRRSKNSPSLKSDNSTTFGESRQ